MHTSDRCSTDRQSNVFAGVSALLLSLIISGCGLFGKDEPAAQVEQSYTLDLQLSASESLNPNTQGRPSPLLVRVFATEAGTEINSTEFEKVFDLNNQVMNPRPLQSIFVRPGEVKELRFQLNMIQTRLLIAAAYRDPHQAIWKSAAIISPQATVNVSATLAESEISIKASSR